MSDWKCGKCGKVYPFNEYINLVKALAVPGEEHPTAPDGHGFHLACECGYEFHRDKWRLQTQGYIDHHMTLFHNLFHALSRGRLCKPHRISWNSSSVFLELNHGLFDDSELYYEAMLFASRGVRKVESYGQRRYETLDEAEVDHAQIISNLAEGKYIVFYRFSPERDPHMLDPEFKEGLMVPARFEWRVAWESYDGVDRWNPLHGCKVGVSKREGYGS